MCQKRPLSDVNSEELGSPHPLYSSDIEGQREVLDAGSPEVLVFPTSEGKVVVSGQLVHLTSVAELIAHHNCVICKFHKVFGLLSLFTVISEHGDEQGGEHATLGHSHTVRRCWIQCC